MGHKALFFASDYPLAQDEMLLCSSLFIQSLCTTDGTLSVADHAIHLLEQSKAGLLDLSRSWKL